MRIAAIETDGTPDGTRVLDESGEQVHGITNVTWKVGADGTWTVSFDANRVKIVAPPWIHSGAPVPDPSPERP